MNHIYSQYCSPINKNSLEVKVKVSPDVKSVMLIYGDPHNYIQYEDGVWGWQKKEIEMRLDQVTRYNKYYSAILIEEKSRFKYTYVIELEDGEKIYYGPSGRLVVDNVADIDNFASFYYPYIHDHEFFKGPSWVKNQVWLQIYVDRFHNGDKNNDPEDVLEWGIGEPTGHTFHGGDLRGIIDKLGYIKELGYTGIYLTPIFLAPTAHKYDTLDYMKIDPIFGTEEELKELVYKAHEKGIKIMLDAVFNHSSNKHEYFLDIIEKKAESEYLDYYHITNLEPFEYETFANVLGMPKWNTRNPKVTDYFIKVLNHYIEEFGIDGWRFDVANELDHTFVRQINKNIKTKYPDFYLLAEIWHDPIDWISYDQFDANMEYEIGWIFVKLMNQTLDVDETIERIADIHFRTPKSHYSPQFHMINSHDTARIFNMVGKNKKKAIISLFFLALQKGSVCFYYGDEYLMEGENDPFCRRCLPLDISEEDLQIKEIFKKIIEFRKNNLDIIQEVSERYINKDNSLVIDYDELIIEIDPINDRLLINGKELAL